MKHKITLLIFICLLVAGCDANPSRTPLTLNENQSLIVAWVDRGNLLIWQQGDDSPRQIATGAVVRPYIAPDGQHIAFTRGPNGRSDTLWLVDIAGTSEQLLMGEGKPRGFRTGQALVGDVGWLDESTIYANTAKSSNLGIHFNDDLYRINTRTREVSLILRPGDGGKFFFSPDKKHIAVTSAGTYGKQDGRISVMEPIPTGGTTDLLYYIGVATGSEAPFYPHLQWTPDNQSILTALPDSDLIYHDMETTENIPPTRLWQFPIENPSDRNLIGSVTSSIFGLPLWSDDDSHLLYLRRTPNSNDFTIVVAQVNGENPLDYQSGTAGTIEPPKWLPHSQQFIYSLDNPGTVYLGQANQEPQLLSEQAVFSPNFLTEDFYVFVTLNTAGTFQLAYARIGYSPVSIGTSLDFIPIFDARFVDAVA